MSQQLSEEVAALIKKATNVAAAAKEQQRVPSDIPLTLADEIAILGVLTRMADELEALQGPYQQRLR